jgi:hypothetical protein
MPAVTSQAQFNAFMASFDALRFTFNEICAGNLAQETEGRKALDMSLELGRKVTEVTEQLKDIPEAATSKAAEEYKNPPAQYYEYDIQRALLSELEQLAELDKLNEWYSLTKERREMVKTSSLRNALFDAIRSRKSLLTAWGLKKSAEGEQNQ